MERIDEKTVECEGMLYTIRKGMGGETCSRCSCYPCRSNGKAYLSQCWKLIGGDYYLKRDYDKGTIRED